MLWNQFKGTETLLPVSRAVFSPNGRPQCPQAKWSVNFIELLVPDLGACFLFQSQLSIWFVLHVDPWFMTSIWSKWIKRIYKIAVTLCYNSKKCCCYIYFGSMERTKHPPHYRMHGGKRETMHTYIFSLTQARKRRLNYVRPSSSARTYLQQFVVLCIQACTVSRM